MSNCFFICSDYQPVMLDEWIVIELERMEKMHKNKKEHRPVSIRSDPPYDNAAGCQLK